MYSPEKEKREEGISKGRQERKIENRKEKLLNKQEIDRKAKKK